MDIPVLEPDLDLSRAESRYFTSKTLAVSSVGVSLSSELTHQETCLIVCESKWDVSMGQLLRSYERHT
jgi:hypothetical protein